MENFQEKRKHKRVEGVFEVFIDLNPELPEKFYCHSSDISEGGMKIRTTKPLKYRHHAILTFGLPNYPTKITTQAVVAWASSYPKEDGSFEAGIKFIIINNTELEAIRSYISQHTERTL